MKATLATLVLSCVLGAPAVASTQPPPPQALSINIHADGARATQQPQYDPSAPIDVSVKETGDRAIDAITVIANSPAGATSRTPLVRLPDGTFHGTLELPDEGLWRLRLTSRTGTISTDTTPVTLDVKAPPASNAWQVGVAVGVGVFVVVGVSGFFLLRRAAGRDNRRAPVAAA